MLLTWREIEVFIAEVPGAISLLELLVGSHTVAEEEEAVVRVVLTLIIEVFPAWVGEDAHGVQAGARPEPDDAPGFVTHFVPGAAGLAVYGLWERSVSYSLRWDLEGVGERDMICTVGK